MMNSVSYKEISLERVVETLRSLIPLTLPHRDSLGRVIQLWKVHNQTLVGSVIDLKGKISLIHSSKIKNVMQGGVENRDLIERLESFPLKSWNLVYDAVKVELSIWPILKAEGKDDKPDGFRDRHNPFKNDTHAEAVARVVRSCAPRHKEYFRGENPAQGKGSYLHYNRNGKLVATYHFDPKDQGRYREDSHIDVTFHAIGKTYRFRYKDDPPPQNGSSGNPPKGGGNDPAIKNFKQLLDQTKLTDSYNAANPGSPLPEKGGVGGKIGGVACSIEYMEGLFDSPDALFEMDHYFCLPANNPFSNEQLRQILRELAMGIYVHNTVPFFSLHFRQKTADLFPVIHPVYENTLVGRVIGMLDYFMKGYLNGGAFKEDFVDNWHNDPDWKKKAKDAEASIIDFHPYCQTHLEGAYKLYISARDLELLEKHDDDEPPILKEFKGFRNSFRIIAKQNSYQKKDDLFYIDADFDVRYTIEPSPEYLTALEEYKRTHQGNLPASYKNMERIYEIIAKRIHSHMVKMPLCKGYFSMLGVINFFSSYFHTLKKHRKVPVLPPMEKVDTKGCPPLFPYLPIVTKLNDPIQGNPAEAFKNFCKNNYKDLSNYFNDLFQHLLPLDEIDGKAATFNPTKYESFLKSFIHEIKNDIFNRAEPLTKRFINSNDDLIEEAVKENARDYFEGLLCGLEMRIIDEQKLPSAKRAYPQTLAKEFLSTIAPDFMKPFDREIGIPIKGIPRVAKIKLEVSDEELEKGERVVGGCGMELEVKKVTLSAKAGTILEKNWKQLDTLEAESFKEVDLEQGKGVVFRLSFATVPPNFNNNYIWMDSLLSYQGDLIPNLIAAMADGDHGAFDEAIKSATKEDLNKILDGNGSTLLHKAAKLNDPYYAKVLISKGLSPNEKDSQGFLPIHHAAMEGATNTLEFLLQSHPSTLNAKANNGASPLSTAVLNGHLETTRAILKKNPDPTVLAGGYTDLHIALHEGKSAIIKALLGSSTIVSKCLDVCCKEGGTPLMLACELDDLDILRELLQKNANRDLKRHDGVTALEIAIRRKSIPAITLLLHHAIPSSQEIEAAVEVGTVEIMKLLLEAEGVLNYKNQCGDDLLHLALYHANFPVASLLTQYPSLLTSQSLEMALFSEAWDIVKKLLDAKVEVDPSLLLKCNYHPLFKSVFDLVENRELSKFCLIALQEGNTKAIMEIFQPRGVELKSLQGPNGWGALHYLAKADALYLFRRELDKKQHPLNTLAFIAAENRSYRVFAYLLNLMKGEGLTPEPRLFYAVIESGDFRAVQQMLNLFDNSDAELDSNGTRPAHLAAKMGDEKILKELDNRKADFCIEDKNHRTPLFYSVRLQDKACMKFLLQKKVPISAIDLYEASKKNDPEILQMLLNMKPRESLIEEALQLSMKDKKAFNRLAPFKQKAEFPKEVVATPLKQELQEDPKAVKKFLQENRNNRFSYEIEGQKVWGTPLQLFIRLCDREILKILFSEPFQQYLPSDPNITDSEGDTIAHLLLRENLSPLNIPGMKWDVRNNDGEIPLHAAAMHADPDILESLLNVQSDCQVEDNFGRTPIYCAIQGNQEKNLHLLLTKGANINHRDHELFTPLLFACQMNLFTMIRVLTENGADIDRAGMKEKVAPLHISIIHKQTDTARFLLLHGAKYNILTEKGLHPIHLAAQQGNNALIRIFAAKGVSLGLKDSIGRDARHHAALSGNISTLEEIDVLDSSLYSEDDLTPLDVAASSGQVGAVDWLLRHQANPGKKVLAYTALSKAAPAILPLFTPYLVAQNPDHVLAAIAHAIREDNVEGMKLLYNQGISVNSLIGKSTGLHLASQYGSLECTSWLLQQNCDPFYENQEGENAFTIAASKSSAEQLRLLLDFAELDPDHEFSLGTRLLHIASRSGSLNIAALLISKNASLDVADALGRKPLDFAKKEKQDEMVKLLLACGADIAEGETRLHHAIKSGNILAVKLMTLLEYVDKKAIDLAQDPEIKLHLLRFGVEK